MSDPKIYFGYPDAADEKKENVLIDHVPFKIEDGLKWGNKTEGVQVVVGPKGSGKTAIKRFIEEKEQTSIIWKIDVNNTYLDINANDFSGKSGKIKNYISVLLLNYFMHVLHTESSKRKLDGKVVQNIKDALSRGNEILGNLEDGVKEVNLQFVKLDPKALLKKKTTSVVNNAFTQIADSVNTVLKGKRGYILIDDADDVLENMEKNPHFIEGLVRAVKDINEKFGDRLHVLLFLKSGVFQVWYESQHELYKVQHIIEELKSDETTLVTLIAKRISRIHKTVFKDVNIEQLWDQEFSWKQDKLKFKVFTKRITDLCVSGPRDVLVIANRAKVIAGDDKIRKKHILQILNAYSRDKLNEIGADFGEVFPEIHNLIELVFGGFYEEAKGTEITQHIDKMAFQQGKIFDQFSKHSWFKLKSREKLLLLMFQVGLFGMKRGKTVIYFNHDETIAVGDLLESTLVLHPAFRSVLGISRKRKKK